MGVAGLLLATTAGLGAKELIEPEHRPDESGPVLREGPQGPASGVVMVDNQCVGVTDDPYIFNDTYREIQENIAEENRRSRKPDVVFFAGRKIDLRGFLESRPES